MLDHKNEKETQARSQGHSYSRQSKILMSFQILLKLGSCGVALSLCSSAVYSVCLVCAAPEVQTTSMCSIVSDMFSLGLVVCAIFNQGRPLIQANHSGSTYMKQLEVVSKPDCTCP